MVERWVWGVGLCWLGVFGRELGKLGPGAFMEVELTPLAVTPGLQVSVWLRGGFGV